MQVMKIPIWHDAGEALKVIELLDSLSAALMEQHAQAIEEMLCRNDHSDQWQLPLEDEGVEPF